MERKNKLEILHIVRKACSKIRNNINANKISQATGIKWETVKSNLEILEECGVLMFQDGSYMYYGLIQDIWDDYFILVEEHKKLKEALRTIKNISMLTTV